MPNGCLFQEVLGLTHAPLLYHKLPSLWQKIALFSEDSHLTERAAVKIA